MSTTELEPAPQTETEQDASDVRRNTLNHKGSILLIALALGWIFDFLFWNKVPGVSFAIFAVLCVTAGLVLARMENLRPAPVSLVLLIPISLFAVMSFIRMEPLTATTSRLTVSSLFPKSTVARRM